MPAPEGRALGFGVIKGTHPGMARPPVGESVHAAGPPAPGGSKAAPVYDFCTVGGEAPRIYSTSSSNGDYSIL